MQSAATAWAASSMPRSSRPPQRAACTLRLGCGGVGVGFGCVGVGVRAIGGHIERICTGRRADEPSYSITGSCEVDQPHYCDLFGQVAAEDGMSSDGFAQIEDWFPQDWSSQSS